MCKSVCVLLRTARRRELRIGRYRYRPRGACKLRKLVPVVCIQLYELLVIPAVIRNCLSAAFYPFSRFFSLPSTYPLLPFYCLSLYLLSAFFCFCFFFHVRARVYVSVFFFFFSHSLVRSSVCLFLFFVTVMQLVSNFRSELFFCRAAEATCIAAFIWKFQFGKLRV